jgi:lipoyl(octanoyl) transferase
MEFRERRPAMTLHVLPERTAGAAENMATDFLLLQRYPAEHAAVPRFRHYGWRAPAFTFGYAQKIEFVRAQLPAGERFDLSRRPTGGGLVDHREDWTYALVIPRGHPLEERPATESYRAIHEAVGDALRAQGAAVKLQVEAEQERGDPAGVCFQRAEVHDVVNVVTGEKIAGAAQKRNKHGLLFQGSIWRPAASAAACVTLDWDRFERDFLASLGTALAATPQPQPWPDFNEDELSALAEQYASSEWNERR